MKSEFWIARDKPTEAEPLGGLGIYGQKPVRMQDTGEFMPQKMDCEDMMFFECCDCTDWIVLNSEAFPEVTWENSPQKLTIELAIQKLK